jgi:hypothetical protein
MTRQPPHTPESEAGGEKWKTRPSTETTADEGENARVTREHREQENTPRAPAEKSARRAQPPSK